MTTRYLDIAVSLFFILFGGWVVQQSLAYGVTSPIGPGSGLFPLAAGLLMGVLSIGNLFRAMTRREDLRGMVTARELVPTAAVVALTLVFLWIVGHLGIFGPLPFFLVLISLCVHWRTDPGWLLRILVGAMAFTGVCYLVFAQALNIPLPRGPWGF